MRRLLAAFLCVLIFAPAIAVAQNAAVSTTPVRQPDIRANPVYLNAASLNTAADVQINNAQGVVGWSVTGLAASGAALSAFVSNDGGQHWAPAPLFDANCNELVSITADGQYRVAASGHTDVELEVTTAGIGQITAAYTASAVSSLADCSAPSSLPSNLTSIHSSVLEGDHVFKTSAGTLLGFSVTIGATKGWLLIFDATTDPADGSVTPLACYPIETDGTFGNGSGQWSSGTGLRFSNGLVFSFSSTGCFTKTESATAYFRADFQ